MDEDRGERWYGPYPHKRRFRVIAVGANGEREAFSFPTADEATRWKTDREAEAQGRTVTQAIAAYRMSMEARGLRDGTVATAIYRLTGLLGQREMLLSVLTPGRARELFAARAQKVKPETQRKEVEVASAFTRWCISQRWMKHDPFDGIEVIGPRAAGKPKLRIDEARRLRDVALAEGSVEGLAVATALLTGARATEVTGRVVRDVDDDCSILWIDRAKTKAGERSLPLHPDLQPRFRELVKGRSANDPLFGDVDRHWLSYHTRRLCKLARVPVVSAHGLRGTVAEIGAERNQLDAISEALGHADTGVTVRSYAGKRAAIVGKVRAAWKVLAGGVR